MAEGKQPYATNPQKSSPLPKLLASWQKFRNRIVERGQRPEYPLLVRRLTKPVRSRYGSICQEAVHSHSAIPTATQPGLAMYASI
jgi:hypothetical protein